MVDTDDKFFFTPADFFVIKYIQNSFFVCILLKKFSIIFIITLDIRCDTTLSNGCFVTGAFSI